MWFRQLPFLTLLVFGIGVGLGGAWKLGWVPIELTSAQTGTLELNESAVRETSPTVVDPAGPPTAPNELLPEDPAIFAAQSEPDDDPPVAQTESRSTPRLRPGESPRVVPVVRSESDEPEWTQNGAPGPTQRRTESVAQAGNIRPQLPAREIKLVSSQDPSERETEASPANPVSSTLAETLTVVDKQIADQEFLAAHRTLSKLYWNDKDSRGDVLPRLHVTSRAIFFEPRPHLVDPYVVQANDQMRIIANKYQLSWEYLAKLNRTEPQRLQPGQKLKVLKGPFAAVVDLGEFALTVHLQGYFVKRYEVGIGKDGASPLGKFTVLNKIKNPQYTGPDGKVVSADDPANPLGERWIDLGDSYGIHGTIEPDSIGKAASRGCIRMRASDVIEVYDFLVKGSEVTIRK